MLQVEPEQHFWMGNSTGRLAVIRRCHRGSTFPLRRLLPEPFSYRYRGRVWVKQGFS